MDGPTRTQPTGPPPTGPAPPGRRAREGDAFALLLGDETARTATAEGQETNPPRAREATNRDRPDATGLPAEAVPAEGAATPSDAAGDGPASVRASDPALAPGGEATLEIATGAVWATAPASPAAAAAWRPSAAQAARTNGVAGGGPAPAGAVGVGAPADTRSEAAQLRATATTAAPATLAATGGPTPTDGEAAAGSLAATTEVVGGADQSRPAPGLPGAAASDVAHSDPTGEPGAPGLAGRPAAQAEGTGAGARADGSGAGASPDGSGADAHPGGSGTDARPAPPEAPARPDGKGEPGAAARAVAQSEVTGEPGAPGAAARSIAQADVTSPPGAAARDVAQPTTSAGAGTPATPTGATGVAPGAPPAPAATALPGATPRALGLARAVEGIEATIRMATTRNASVMRIALTPPELGRLTVRLRHTTAGISASVNAESEEAAQALQHATGELRRALEAGGITLLGLEINSGGDPGTRSREDGERSAAEDVPGGRRQSGGADENPATRPASTIELANGLLVDVLA